ncbi:NeuD/PglB/VioB family sugar acetyltransferase [Curvivirga sp.]|uniref:NeuD/PglB/VioB family sugar acetyltransferase n=1 Tax=Curvivirga sp. TaxID=2856848 RepID=UPI003B5B8508
MPKKHKPLIILGAGAGISSILSIAYARNYVVSRLVDPRLAGDSKYDVPIKADFKDVDPDEYYFAIGVGDNTRREKIYQETSANYPELVFLPLIHPSAVISQGAKIGEGTIIMPNVVVGAQCDIGQFCMLNTMSSIDHDGVMADFSSLAPGAILAGQVTLGPRSNIAIGAKVKHSVTIGANTVIGANSYVHSDMENNVVAYGTPAQVIRSRSKDDPYL